MEREEKEGLEHRIAKRYHRLAAVHLTGWRKGRGTEPRATSRVPGRAREARRE